MQDEAEIASHDSEQAPLLESHYALSKWRHCIVILYGLLCMIVGLSYTGYSSISTQIQQLYNISVTQSSWINSAYYVMSLVFILPSIYLLGYVPVRVNILIVVVVTIVGSWLRCLINVKLIYAAVGQYIFAISFVFLRSIPTRLSAIWFAPGDRAMATSVMFSLLFSFDVLSLFIPVLFVAVNVIPVAQQPKYRSRLFLMHLIQALITTTIGILVILFFKQKPIIPVSPTAIIERTKFFKTLKLLLCDRHFIFIALFVAFTDGILDVYRIVMKDAFQNYGITSSSIGIYSLISVPFTVASINVSGYIAVKVKREKGLMLGMGGFFLLLLVSLIPLMNLKSADVFGIIQILFQTFGPPVATLGFEMAAEQSFPVPQGFSASFTNLLVKLTTIVLIQVTGLFVLSNHMVGLIGLYIGLEVVALVLMGLVKEQHKRANKDAEIIERMKKQAEEI